MAEVAKKRDPEKWARAKAKARKKLGGHSARAMQLATKYYKEAAYNVTSGDTATIYVFRSGRSETEYYVTITAA